LTAAGHPRAIFKRAIERGNLPVAEVTAREMGKVTLEEALELTALIAFKDPRRHGRAGARWMRRYLEENESVPASTTSYSWQGVYRRLADAITERRSPACATSPSESDS
jgi:hypothetical protein